MPYPSPYDRKNQRWPCLLAFFTMILAILFLVFFVVMGITKLSTDKPVLNHKTHDSLTINYTHNGEEIRTYVMIDPDTNIQYLINDRGGMVRRDQE